MWRHRTLFRHILIGILLGAGAAGLRHLFSPHLGSRLSFLFYVLAVAGAAQIGGTISGLIVTGLGAIVIGHLTPPSDKYILTVLIIYGAVGVALSIFGGWRKRTEKELQRIRYNLETAQHIANVGSWESDLGKAVLWWSAETYNIFGFRQCRRLTQEDFYQRVHPEDRERVRELATNAIRNKTDYNVEHRIVRCDGEVRHVHQIAKVLCNDKGAPICLIGSIQDITERKQAEQEIRILRGLLPICAHCKRIRDDKGGGTWSEVEVYVKRHSEADFTHTLCPACVREFYR